MIKPRRVTIIKDWDWPDLNRQTPGHDGVWNGIHFSLDPSEPCDILVVLNNRLTSPVTTVLKGNNVWALMQEPYAKGVTDWLVEKHGAFDKVFTHWLPLESEKYIRSHPAIPWHVDFTYNELLELSIPVKKNKLSWVVGNVKDLPGHIKRMHFLQLLRQNGDIDIDLYGKAVKFIESKNEALLPYQYSLAVENTCTNDYWTEKIADCLLSWTVPIYYGCPNLESYFPEKAFIRIDITRPDQALDRIRDILSHDDWQARIEHIKTARELILNRYQLFPHLCSMLNKYSDQDGKVHQVKIPAYRRSPKSYFNRRVYKIRKAFNKI